MAMIYDMVTGRVVDDSEYTNRPAPASTSSSSPELLAVHTIDTAAPVEEMSPVDAYMVMLQDLLKKL